MLLVDTNVWLAAADRRSKRHGECAGLLRAREQTLGSTVPVIAETSWLLLDRLGPAAQLRFVRMVTTGDLAVVELTSEDWRRVAELIERYVDLRLDVVDASLVAVAERLGESRIATLNHRDFAAVRPRHVAAFELLPRPTQATDPLPRHQLGSPPAVIRWPAPVLRSGTSVTESTDRGCPLATPEADRFARGSHTLVTRALQRAGGVRHGS